ncbi:hypothetical protein [Rhodococcus sp. ARC_M5]|nr:hypothetical protein [Rhodococcus sp. ARC_M5]MCJ0891356.1 hypothetical protein [Rhodococcus sp. ARC_M5]
MGAGWITVDAAALRNEAALQFWVSAALEHNANPPNPANAAKTANTAGR